MQRKITPMSITKYLRNKLNMVGLAKKDKCCYISGKTTKLESHHANMSFGNMVMKAHKKLNIEYKTYISNYTLVELVLLKDEVVKLHSECKLYTLSADIHLMLHKKYGRDVNEKDIEEFKMIYNNQTDIAI